MDRMKPDNEWWKPTANHIWRTYFNILKLQGMDLSKPLPLTTPELTAYNVCSKVSKHLPVPSDIDILRMFYTTPKGQELHNVEDFSIRNNVPVHIIWKAIRHANRAVMVELGLLDGKV